MRTHRLWLIAVPALFLATAAARAAEATAPKGVRAAQAGDDQALAARIDHHLAAGWRAATVEPAAPADDAEFLRRAYLDLVGRIPSVAEARAFLRDTGPDKRRRLVDRLLESRGYANHFATVWRTVLIPEASASMQARFLAPGLEAWLRQKFAANAGYDAMVRELLTTPVGTDPRMGYYGGNGQANPAAFYLAKELKPENLAAGVTRVFLGVRLECAQCHDHPFASWSRDQFWGMAAFFAGIQRQQQGDFVLPKAEVPDRKELTIPGSERVVQAGFLDGTDPQWRFKVNTRATLAEWTTSANNPYFARAAVNRLWAHFFGVGLTEPVDDMVGKESVACYPELLDELAREFADHRFDVKFLIRAITSSRAYQLTSVASGKSQDAQRFAHMAVKGLTGEQLYDSVVQATGFQEGQAGGPQFAFYNNSLRSRFLEKFGRAAEKPTEAQTSILQALALMNGKVIADATSVEKSETLRAVIDAPFMDTPEKIETLYLAALARKPRPEELSRMLRYVNQGGANSDKALAEGLSDVFWALLNSSEFILNH